MTDAETAREDPRAGQYAVLRREMTAAVRNELDQARIAMHVLAEGHFGVLNDQQEELVEAARGALDRVAVDVDQLDAIWQFDHDGAALRQEQIRLSDLVANLEPQLTAEARSRGIVIAFARAPGLPAIVHDRLRLQRALESLLLHIVRHTLPGERIRVGTAEEGDVVRVVVEGGATPAVDADVALAQRIIEARGGTVTTFPGRTELRFRAEPAPPRNGV